MKSIFQSTNRSRRHRQAPTPEPEQEQQAPFFNKSSGLSDVQSKPQPFFQAKLTIGQPDDAYEREADTVADKVVNGGHQGAASVQAKEISSVQRLATPDEEKMPATNDGRMREDKMIQEKPLVQRAEAPKEEEKPVQKMEAPKEEERPVQKMEAPKEEEQPVQKMEAPKEEEQPVQKMEAPKEEEQPVQKMEAPKEEEQPVQKMEAPKEEEQPVQKSAATTQANSETKSNSNQASPDFSARLSARKGGGAPLPDASRTQMEQGIGADFSGVRIHTDSEAERMNDDIHAQAFTHGQDVYFNNGKYSPESKEGQRLLAHELTHVVQQGGGLRKIQRQQVDEGHATRYIRPASDEEAAVHNTRVLRSIESLERNAADPGFSMNDGNRAAIQLLRRFYDRNLISFWHTSASTEAAAAFRREPQHHIRLHIDHREATNSYTLLHEATHALHAEQYPGIDRLYSRGSRRGLRGEERFNYLRWRAWTEYWARRRVLEYQAMGHGTYNPGYVHQETLEIRQVRSAIREVETATGGAFNPLLWIPPSEYQATQPRSRRRTE
ncbi:MAG: DUF4157 domain-containing protein [Saprospiraceae bacterium]